MESNLSLPKLTAAVFFTVVSNVGMEHSARFARNTSLKEFNGEINQYEQEMFILQKQVEKETYFTGDCKTDLNRIILYLNRIAEEYNPKSKQAYYHMLMAQTALERLDAYINRYCEAEQLHAAALSFTQTNLQRCQFIKQYAGTSWHELFVNALTMLGLFPLC